MAGVLDNIPVIDSNKPAFMEVPAGNAAAGIPMIQEAPVDPNSFSSNVGRSVDQLQSNWGGTAEAIGDVTGIDPLKEFGARIRKANKLEAAQYGTPDNQSYKDVDSTSDAVQYVTNLFEGALPNMGAILGAGAAAAKVTPGPAPVKAGAALTGAFTAAFADNAGNVQNMQHDIKGEDAEVGSAISLMAGVPMAALDVGGVATLAKPLIKNIGKDAAEQVLMHSGVAQSVAKEAVKGAVLGGAGEAATSASQAVIGNVAAAAGTHTDVDWEKTAEDAINGAIGGGIAGSFGGAGAHGVAAIKHNNLVDDGKAPVKSFEDETTLMGKPKTEEPGLFQAAYNGLAEGSLKGLEPLARVSSGMRDFIRAFRPDESGRTATGPTLFEDQRQMAGEYNTKMDELIEKAGGKDKFAQALDDYAAGNYTNPIAAEYKALHDSFWDLARTKGRLNDIGYIDNHLPFKMDVKKIEKNKDAFIDEIAPHYESRDKASEAVDNYLQKISETDDNYIPEIHRAKLNPITGEWDIPEVYRHDKANPESQKFKISQGSIPPEFGHLEKARVFKGVPQATLNKWAVEQTPKQKINAVRDYFEGGAHRIAFSSRFGARGDLANGQLARIQAAAQAQGRRLSKAEVDRYYNVLDAYNGMYHNVGSQKLKTLNSVVSTGVNYSVGTLFALSSLAELATPAIRGDVGTALKAVAPFLGEAIRANVRKIFSGIPKSDWARVASEANLTFDAATNIAAQRLGNNGITRWSAKANTFLFKANGLSFVTHMTTSYAAKTGDILYHQALKELAAGVPMNSPRGRYLSNQLRSMGVQPEMAKTLWNPSTPSEIEMARKARVQAVGRFARQSVVEPNLSDTPLWQHNGHLQLLAMLKKYPTAFTNTILPALFRKGTPSWAGSYNGAVVGGMSALMIGGFMISMGYAQDELKQIAKGIDKDQRTPEQVFQDVITQTLAPVYATYVIDFFNAPRYGSDGMAANAGPVVSKGTEFGKFIYNFADSPSEGEVWKYLYKQTPAAFYRPGREAAGELDLF